MKIKDIITELDKEVIPFPWGISNGTDSLFLPEHIKRLFYKYASWEFCSPFVTDDVILADFAETYRVWSMSNYDSFKKLVDAWESDYNALDNYDRTETGSIIVAKHKGTKTASNTDATTSNSEKTTDSLNAFNSGLTPVSETSGSANDNKSVTQADASKNYTTVTDISGDIFDKDVTTYDNYRTRGNIGVMTPADSIAKEKSLRLTPLATSIVKSFIKEYCYYVG